MNTYAIWSHRSRVFLHILVIKVRNLYSPKIGRNKQYIYLNSISSME